MPPISIKLASGKPEALKAKLAEEITKVVMDVTQNEASAVSVSIEDVNPDDWVEKVYKPDILTHWDTLYKKPGYKPV